MKSHQRKNNFSHSLLRKWNFTLVFLLRRLRFPLKFQQCHLYFIRIIQKEVSLLHGFISLLKAVFHRVSGSIETREMSLESPSLTTTVKQVSGYGYPLASFPFSFQSDTIVLRGDIGLILSRAIDDKQNSLTCRASERMLFTTALQ